MKSQRLADVVRLENFRQAGLVGDHSLVSSMIDELTTGTRTECKLTALHALAQLGESRALPGMQLLIGDTSDTDLCNFAKVSKARLIAEVDSSAFADPKLSHTTKVARFFRELGMTPVELNTDLIAYHESLKQTSVGENRYNYSNGSMPYPTGVYAIRELADMLYHGGYAYCSELPEVKRVNFSDDYPSVLKMRLAPLSREERVHTMVDELANKDVVTALDDYEIQLASDEGITGSHAAAAKLLDMKRHPNHYPRNGFNSLVRVIWGTGDREQAQLVKELEDKGLASVGPMIYWDLVSGISRGRAIAY